MREVTWTYRQISAHLGLNNSTVCCFEQFLLNIPTPVNQVLDDSVKQTHIKIDALCEKLWPPNSILARNTGKCYPAASPRTIGNRLLAAGLRSRLPLPWLPLTPRHVKFCYSGFVKESTEEWNGSLLSSVMRVILSEWEWWTYMCTAHTWWVSSSEVHSSTTHRFHLRLIVWCHQLQLAVTFGVSPGYSKQCPLYCRGY